MDARPDSLEQALRIRTEQRVQPYAGGTDLMVRHRTRSGLLPMLPLPPLFIGHLSGLRGIRLSEDGRWLELGAAETLAGLLESPQIPHVLRLAVAEMASPGIRSLATIGGNIMNASPAADALMPLIALDAYVEARSLSESRWMRLDEFVTGPGRTELKHDELLTCIRIPVNNWDVVHYRKVGTRSADALSKISFAGLARWDHPGQDGTDRTPAESRHDGLVRTAPVQRTLADVRIAIGAVAPVVVRSREAEALLLSGASADAVADAYAPLLKPIDDQRSSAVYRRRVALNLIRDFIRGLAVQREDEQWI